MGYLLNLIFVYAKLCSRMYFFNNPKILKLHEEKSGLLSRMLKHFPTKSKNSIPLRVGIIKHIDA